MKRKSLEKVQRGSSKKVKFYLQFSFLSSFFIGLYKFVQLIYYNSLLGKKKKKTRIFVKTFQTIASIPGTFSPSSSRVNQNQYYALTVQLLDSCVCERVCVCVCVCVCLIYTYTNIQITGDLSKILFPTSMIFFYKEYILPGSSGECLF